MVQVFYIWSMLSLKTALALFFARLLPRRWQLNTVYGLIAACLIFGFIYFWFTVFQCGVPGQKEEPFWIKKVEGKCASKGAIIGLAYLHSLIAAGADLVLVIMPIPLIRTAKIPKREKIIVCVIIGIGSIGGIASLVRMKYINALAFTGVSFGPEFTGLAIWSTIEPGLGITAACMATLRPLLRKVRGFGSQTMSRTVGSHTSKSKSRTTSSGLNSGKATDSSGSRPGQDGSTTLTSNNDSSHNNSSRPGNLRLPFKFFSKTQKPNSPSESPPEVKNEKEGNVVVRTVNNPTLPLSTRHTEDDMDLPPYEAHVHEWPTAMREATAMPILRTSFPHALDVNSHFHPAEATSDVHAPEAEVNSHTRWWDRSNASESNGRWPLSTYVETIPETEDYTPSTNYNNTRANQRNNLSYGPGEAHATDPTEMESGFRKWVIRREPEPSSAKDYRKNRRYRK